MSAHLSIGEFSKLTHLSVKALRHYHDVGLLVPARVDPESRYRRYDAGQAADAQLIRRLRALDMPIESVRDVVAAVDTRHRDAVIAAHLAAMEAQLERTTEVVSSLRAFLEHPGGDVLVERRTLPDVHALAISSQVAHAHVERWLGAAFDELASAADDLAVETSGPGGGVFAAELFAEDLGTVTAYLPVAATSPSPIGGRACVTTIAGCEVLVAEHAGPFADLDLTYATLGATANRLGIATDGAIREIYLVGPDQTADPLHYRTEVCWPIEPARQRSL
jgi:DNA-binding transcriptional MerR regulator